MTDHTDIVERLNGFVACDGGDLADVAEAAAEITRLRAEAAELRSVMIAAAEEIQAHWPAHCDAEGYGPANLMRRLEDGIPSQYAYTAGDFERLRAEAEALRKEAQKSERRAITFGDIMSQHISAMRAAVVAGHLESHAHGLQWIVNTLTGPGHLPDLDEARALGGAQALFDKELAELDTFRAAHPVPDFAIDATKGTT